MARLDLPANITEGEFRTALSIAIGRSRQDLVSLVTDKNKIANATPAEQQAFKRLLLDLVPHRWLPDPSKSITNCRALYSYVLVKVKQTARPDNGIQSLSMRLPDGRQGGRIEPSGVAGPSVAKRPTSSDQPASTPRRRTNQSTPAPQPNQATSSSQPVSNPVVQPNFPLDSSTIKLWRPQRKGINDDAQIVKLQVECFRCGSLDHLTLKCVATALAVSSGRTPSSIRLLDGRTSVHLHDRDAKVCAKWMFETCRKQSGCADSHVCPLCQSSLHHPTRCHLLRGNPRRPLLDPIDRDPRPDFVHPAGPIYIVDRTLGKGFQQPWSWKPDWRPYPGSMDVYNEREMMPQRQPQHRPMYPESFGSLDLSLGALTIGGTTLCSDAAAFLSVKGSCSRIMPGEECRTGENTWAEGHEEIQSILRERIYPAFFLPAGVDVRPELEEEKMRSRKVFQQVLAAEADCVRKKQLSQENLDALTAALRHRSQFDDPERPQPADEYADRFQYPDGVPRLARLLVVGNFPVPHADTRGLTPLAFSTRLMSNLGVNSPSTTHDLSVAYRNRIGMYFPASARSGIYYPASNKVAAKKMPKPIVDIWEEDLRQTYLALFETEGARVVISYGSENTSLVERVVKDRRAGKVFEWECKFPGVNMEETASSAIKNAGVRAIIEGVLQPTLESYTQVEEEVWSQLSTLIQDLKNELGASMDRRWDGQGAVKMALAHSERSTTLFLMMEHPETVDKHFHGLGGAVALNLGSTYAADFYKGSLYSGDYDPPRWPYVDAYARTMQRLRAGDEHTWVRGREYEADYGVLVELDNAQKSILRGQAKEPFYFGQHHLPPHFQRYLDGIEFVREDHPGAIRLQTTYSDVVGIMRWSVRERGATPWNEEWSPGPQELAG